MHEFASQRKEIERKERDFEITLQKFNISGDFRKSIEEKHVKEIENQKKYLIFVQSQADKIINHIKNNAFDELTSKYIHINKNIGISTSSCPNLRRVINFEKSDPMISFNILPEKNHTTIIFSWFTELDNYFSEFYDKFESDPEYLINYSAFYGSEHTCINPDLWESNTALQGVATEIQHLFDHQFFEKNIVPKIIELN